MFRHSATVIFVVYILSSNQCTVSAKESECCGSHALLSTQDMIKKSPRSDRDAELLALRVGNELVASDEDYQRISSDLQAIRRVTGFGKSLLPLASSIVLYADHETAEEIVSGQNNGINCLNAWYRGRIGYSSVYTRYTMIFVEFDQIFNAKLITAAYASQPGIKHVDPDMVIGADFRIQLCNDCSGTHRYIFLRGSGDCIAGCINWEKSGYDVTPGGQVTRLGPNQDDYQCLSAVTTCATTATTTTTQRTCSSTSTTTTSRTMSTPSSTPATSRTTSTPSATSTVTTTTLKKKFESECCGRHALLSTQDMIKKSPRSDRDAEILALRVGNELVASDEDYQRISSDLQAIRQVAGFGKSLLPLASSLILYADREITEKIVSGQNNGINCLNAWYGGRIGYSSISRNIGMAFVEFDHIFKPKLIADAYASQPGIVFVEPDSVIGANFKIVLCNDCGGTHRYIFSRGSGDCSAGCITWEKSGYDVTPGGQVTRLGPNQDDYQCFSAVTTCATTATTTTTTTQRTCSPTSATTTNRTTSIPNATPATSRITSTSSAAFIVTTTTLNKKCLKWCAAGNQPWSKKCTWVGKCAGCAECGKSSATTITSTATITSTISSTSSATGITPSTVSIRITTALTVLSKASPTVTTTTVEKTCEKWCAASNVPWRKKCTWMGSCAGCAKCNKSSIATSSSVTIISKGGLTLDTATASPVCATCGTIKKSGELSCCARGGAWFKNCGDPGEPGFDHTWFEGIQACSDSSSMSGKAQSHIMSGHKTGHARENTFHESNDPQRKNTGFVSANPATTDGQGCHELGEITFFMSLLLTLHSTLEDVI